MVKMRLLVTILLVIPATQCKITVPGEKVDKKTLTSLGIKTLDWQHEKDQGQHEQTRVDDDTFGELEISSSNEKPIYQMRHDLQHIISTEKHHLEDFDEYVDQTRPEAFLQCPAEQTGSFPHALSCNQFWNCWKGRGFLQNCSPGTLFNPHTYECDYAPKVQCLQQSPSSAYTQQTLSSLHLKTGCPNGFSGVVPHHYDCSKFINCNNGQEVVLDCGPGTLFNLKINSCDYPNNAECASWSSQFGRIVDQSQEGSSNVYVQHTLKQPKCPPDVTGLLPHPSDCSKFLNCASGQTFIQDCGPGTHFNPETTVCDFPYNVKCENSGDYSGAIDVRAPTDTLRCPLYVEGVYPHPHSCSKYVNCYRGYTEVKECLNGLMYNPISNGCDNIFNVDCSRKNVHNIWEETSDQSTSHSQHSQKWNQEWSQHGQNQQGAQQGQDQGSIQNWNHNGHNTGTAWTQQAGTQSWQSGTSWNQQSTGQNWNQNGQNTGTAWHKQVDNQGQQSNIPWNQQNLGQNWNQNGQDTGTAWHKQVDNQGQQGNIPWNQQNLGQNWNQNGQDTGTAWHKQVDNQGQQSNIPWNQENLGQNWNQHEQSTGASNQWNQWQTQTQNQHVDTTGNHQNANENWNQQQQNQQVAWNQPNTNQKWDEHSTWSQQQQGSNQQTPGWNQQQQISSQQKPGGNQGWNQGDQTQAGTAWNQNWNRQEPNQGSQNWNIQGQTQQQQVGQGSTAWNRQQQQQNGDWSQTGGTVWNEPSRNQQQGGTAWNDQRPSSQGGVKGGKSWKNLYPTDNRNEPGITNSNEVKPSQNLDQSQSESQINENAINAPSANLLQKNSCSVRDFPCSLTTCIPRTMHCDGVADCPDGSDERNCEKILDQFEMTQNHILAVREKEKFFNVTTLNCAKACLESKSFQCRSFSYRRDDGACFLSDANIGASGSLILSYPYDYYELLALTMNCTGLHHCPNQKCISYKQICDGVNDCGDRTDEKGCPAQSFGYEIKLAGSEEKHEGRVEIRAFGQTGYICDDKFGLRNAEVVCKELGFSLGALEVKGNSFFAQDISEKETLYLMDDVMCLGNETSIRDCDFNGWGVSNCELQEIAGVVCKTPQETCPKDHWKCESVPECIPLVFLCDGVYDCTDQSDEHSNRCESPTQVRLTGGSNQYEGRIEVSHFGVWGTVCDDDFNDDAAKVVCKSLGHPGKAYAKKDGGFGPGAGPIWLDQVFCQGNESSLEHCAHWNWGEHNCEHSEDVGVVCSSSHAPVVESERNAHLENLPESVFIEQCGLRKDAMFLGNDDVHFRVVGGAIAEKGDYPWQASLRIKNQGQTTHWCGAVVITKKFILTAAHCLQGFSKGAYVVVAGDYNTDEDEGTEQEAYIEEFYIHERFRVGQKMNNDIALIKLKGAGFLFTRDVQPICLPDSNVVYTIGLNCTISGFGSIQSGKSSYSHDMRAAYVPLIAQDVCKMPHVYGDTITDGMVCAGSLDEGADACEGDSGGPLACLHDGYYTLYGLTSWGHHCGHANKPGVYVRVAHYRKWIDEMILKHV